MKDGNAYQCDEEVHVLFGNRKRCQCGKTHIDDPVPE